MAIREGWALPGRSRKYHYFRNAESLCGKWLFNGLLEVDDGRPSPDDCAAFRKKRDAECEMTPTANSQPGA